MNTRPLITILDGVLIPQGFIRHGHTWNRRINPYVDVIDFQQNKAGDAVTVNCGVLHVEIHRVCWGKDEDEFVEEPSCTVRSRIGDLINGHDLWWKCTDVTNPADIIVAQVRSAVLPFLERMHSEAEMDSILSRSQVEKRKYPPPILYLAALRCRRGDRESASTMLTVLHDQTTSPWKSKVAEVAARLSLSLRR